MVCRIHPYIIMALAKLCVVNNLAQVIPKPLERINFFQLMPDYFG